MPSKYHNNGSSIDGTIEFLNEIKSEKIHVISIDRMWESKEEQINSALEYAKGIFKENCFLWEIDIDEQWNLESIQQSENYLIENKAKTGEFLCNYYVGDGLVAKGEWGEGKYLPYRRLWKWEGEKFKSHEPPELENGNGKTILIPYRFNHYSYYFEQDVKFKNDWYKGHGNIYEKWLKLKDNNNFPIHIKALVGGRWGRTNTFIYKEMK